MSELTQPSWTILNEWRKRAQAAEARVEELEEALRMIANSDYRGNEPRERIIARRALGGEQE